MVRFADLDPADQRAIRRGQATVTGPPRSPRRAKARPGSGRWRCCACGDKFVQYGAAEKHVDADHSPCGRIEMLLESHEKS